jgi:hypothetical protein
LARTDASNHCDDHDGNRYRGVGVVVSLHVFFSFLRQLSTNIALCHRYKKQARVAYNQVFKNRVCSHWASPDVA